MWHRFSATGDFLGQVGLSVNVTERKKTEETLRKGKHKLVAKVADVMVYET